MKKIFWLFAVLLFAALKSQAQTDLIARIHFLGGDKISTDTNSPAFANEFTSPEARALENQTLDKLAKFFAAQFKFTNSAVQLRPLLDDLLKSEWIWEVRDANNGSSECMLAIHLSSERAQFWSRNLAAALQNWIGTGISADKSGNWEARKVDSTNLYWNTNHAANLLRFARVQDWIVIGAGENQLPLTEQTVQKFSHSGLLFKDEGWLSADLNWPRLAQLFPSLREFDFPKIAFQAVGRDANFHFTGKLNLPQPLPPLEAWRVPTNSIHQPFVSFTAARGVVPQIEKQMWFQPFQIQPMPGQIFIWALPGIAFQTFDAVSVPNANAALSRLYGALSANENWQGNFMMPLHMTLTNNQLSFTGVPFIAPNIRATHETSGDFLVGGFFPNTPRSKPLPPELFQQLNAPDLVYYHWEITAERLKELPELSQLLLMVTKHQQLNGQSVAHQWLSKIEPTLGNCVTRATETSPSEISFTRKSPAGLTAIELLALANWLESPNFPAFDLRAPERPRIRNRLHPQATPSPSPGIPAPVQK